MLKELKTKLKINEETIANLKHQNATLQQKVVANSSRYGQIEVGLVYHPVAAKLEIHCFNASGIQGSCITIRTVKFLSKNSILTKTPTFSRVFQPKFFFTIFFVKLRLSTAKKSKTTTFSRVFHPEKSTIFSGKKINFLDKKWRFRTVWFVKLVVP